MSNLLIILFASGLLALATATVAFFVFFQRRSPAFTRNKIDSKSAVGDTMRSVERTMTVSLFIFALSLLALVVTTVTYAPNIVLTDIVLIAAGIFSVIIVAVTAVAFWRALFEKMQAISPFVIEIDGQEVKGEEKDKKRLEVFGGPGELKIHPGQVVVLHKGGKITRAIGAGSVKLEEKEKIKAVLPLGNKADIQQISNVLTRDRIPLDISVLRVTQLEPAEVTKARLQQAVTDAEAHLQAITSESRSEEDVSAAKERLEYARQQLEDLENKDKRIGDGYDECYESVAKLVATKVPDVWDGLHNPVTGIIRDAMMCEDFNELFGTNSGDGKNLEARINQRKTAEIEGIVFEKVEEAEIGKGIVLREIDIRDIRFPEEIEKEIREGKKREIKAEADITRAALEAQAVVTRARAKAQARILEGQAEGEARAAFFREVLREMKREGVLGDEEMVAAVLRQLINTMVTVKDLETFVKSAGLLEPLSRRRVMAEEEGQSLEPKGTEL